MLTALGRLTTAPREPGHLGGRGGCQSQARRRVKGHRPSALRPAPSLSDVPAAARGQRTGRWTHEPKAPTALRDNDCGSNAQPAPLGSATPTRYTHPQTAGFDEHAQWPFPSGSFTRRISVPDCQASSPPAASQSRQVERVA